VQPEAYPIRWGGAAARSLIYPHPQERQFQIDNAILTQGMHLYACFWQSQVNLISGFRYQSND
jgi:hypothetical protein